MKSKGNKKKNAIEIYKGILRVMLKNPREAVSIQTLSKENNCNWLTIRKYSLPLVKGGILESVNVEGREIAFKFNLWGIVLLHQVMREEGMIENRDLIHELLEDIRVVPNTQKNRSGGKE